MLPFLAIAPIMSFVKENWKLVTAGVIIAGTLGYIGILRHQVDHYKGKYQQVQLAYDTAVIKAKEKEEALSASNKALTEKYEFAAKKYASLSLENQKNEIEKIRLDKELRAIKLSNRTVSLFNESTNPGSANNQKPTEAKPVDDGARAAPEAPSGQTLADLLAVSVENNLGHRRCVAKLTAWQSFWTEFVAVVERANDEARTDPS